MGRFFQVTETTDFRKYFLDIDKVQRFPITFVVKSEAPMNHLLNEIRDGATKAYGAEVVVERYMAAIEEVINLPILLSQLDEVIGHGDLRWSLRRSSCRREWSSTIPRTIRTILTKQMRTPRLLEEIRRTSRWNTNP